jgi:ADP-dependent NAD(P)H-hydrate dehydratase / NAD(P)H-hydrate epimerase
MSVDTYKHSPDALPVCTADTIGQWDRYTIVHEPISSIALMERACRAFIDAFIARIPDRAQSIVLLAGKGNNGGDALGIARLLVMHDYVSVMLVCENPQNTDVSDDYLLNFERLPRVAGLRVLYWNEDWQASIPPGSVLIDGLLGTGFRPPLQGALLTRLQTLEKIRWKHIIAIDLPSGLNADTIQGNSPVLAAHETFTFGQLKRSFLFQENARFTGDVNVLDIGLHPDFRVDTSEYFINEKWVGNQLGDGNSFSHKYHFGLCTVIAGSDTFPGAAVLAAMGCYRSGAGLVEVICSNDLQMNWLSVIPEVIPRRVNAWIPGDKTTSVLYGSGIVRDALPSSFLPDVLARLSHVPWVIDAEGINAFLERKLKFPNVTVVTPHAGEFDRIAGPSANSEERLLRALDFAREFNVMVVLKGKYSRVVFPDGRVYFNTSGNVSLAKGGSGDVLAGILCGLLAQGYSVQQAVLCGVYLHGLSADILCRSHYTRSIQPSEVAIGLSDAFLYLQQWNDK